MDRPVEPPVAREQPEAPGESATGAAPLVVRPSTALVDRVGQKVRRLVPGLGQVRDELRQWRDGLWRHPLAEELERTRRENEQLQQLLAELPEIFERKYQQRLEPLLEHQYRLLEDNALLMDQLRLLQSSPAPDLQQLAADPFPPSTAPDPLDDPMHDPDAPFPTSPAEPESVHLSGTAPPPLADVRSLLHSPPWGVLTPSLVEVRQASSAAQPTSPPARPSFEELVSMASQQLQSAAVEDEAVEPTEPEASAPEAFLVPPEPPVEPAMDPAMEPEPIAAIDAMTPALANAPSEAVTHPEALPQPEVASQIEEVSRPEAASQPEVVAQAEVTADLEDIDPLEQARSRRLQAWRRTRQQGQG